MTVYAVTGASGPFGHHVVEGLLATGVQPGEVVAVVRAPDKVADLAAAGVQVRAGDYNAPETLAGALEGVDVLLLVSGSEVGSRVPQHTAVIEAAREAGVSRIVYTSAPRADVSELILAPEHKATEAALIASGVPYTILRNNWYYENYTPQIPTYLEHGEILGAAGDGRIAAATRADFADAAVAVLVGQGHENTVYELAGQGFTMSELAAAISAETGADVSYRNVSVAELTAALEAVGLPAGTAAFVAAIDEGIARGDLDLPADDLTRLLGRPATSLAEAVSAAKG